MTLQASLHLYYFYPRSPCGERPVLIRDGFLIDDISIHALLAESDFKASHLLGVPKCISIHALLAESDLSLSFGHIFPYNISIHALLAESDTLQFMRARTVAISIHALLAESDLSLHVSQIDA